MGQYYRAIDVDTGEHIGTWDFDCGSKLMEHAYVGNGFTDAIQHAIREGRRMITCGDYAWHDGYGDRLRAMGFDGDPWDSEDEVPVDRESVKKGGYRYTVNVSRGEYVDRSHACVAWIWRDDGNGEVVVARYDPTCLLIAVGNGLGGGDYREMWNPHKDANGEMVYCDRAPGEGMVGAWAGDTLVATDDPEDVEHLTELPCPFDERGVFLTAPDDEIVSAIRSGMVTDCGDLWAVRDAIESASRSVQLRLRI